MEENIVKKIKEELGLTYEELGKLTGLKGSSLRVIATKDPNEVSEQVEIPLKLLLENFKLKGELEKVENFKSILKDFIETAKSK